MKFVPTGKYASEEQLKEVTTAFDLDYRTPAMAVGAGHKRVGATVQFRELARQFAVAAGLPEGHYAIDPTTREFIQIEMPPDQL